MDELLASDIVEALVWSLCGTFWLGSAMALVCAAILRGLDRSRAELRYAVAYGSLVALCVCPVLLTILHLSDLSMIYAFSHAHPWITFIAPWLLALWLAAFLLNVLRVLDACARTNHIMRAGCWKADRDVQGVVQRVYARMHLKRMVDERESVVVHVPAVYGFLRPILVIPVWMMREMNPSQLEGIVAHELAHVRRNDWIMNLCQVVMESMLFFHPAVWWLGRFIRQEREYCCDDAAVQVCRNAVEYARALVHVEETRLATPVAALSLTDGNLHARISRLLYASESSLAARAAHVAGRLAAAAAVATFPAIF